MPFLKNSWPCTLPATLHLLSRLIFILAFYLASTASAASNSPAASAPDVHRLRLYHTHTNEHIDIVYRKCDHYLPGAVRQLNYFLRDHRTGTVHRYDPHVFDLLSDLTASVGEPGAEIDIICGYRTPKSNAFLRHRSHAVAEHSLHMQAKAIDIRLPGVDTAELRDAALALHRGGVGYYQREDFVHVDVGRVRHW
jgi:uncharacterized protein YcbK (DUF882 family)